MKFSDVRYSREIGSVVLSVPVFYFRKRIENGCSVQSFYQTIVCHIAYVRLWTTSEAVTDRASGTLEKSKKLKYDATQRACVLFP